MPDPVPDPLIHQHTRLRIMALLVRNRDVAATELRAQLGLTAGNLASHAGKLEEAGYIESRRVLVDLSFEVHVRITDQGHRAFLLYLEALEAMLAEAREAAPTYGEGHVAPRDTTTPSGHRAAH